MTALNPPAANPKSPFASMKGNHVAFRVPDFAASKAWFVDKLDFRVIHEWPFGDLQLAYLAPSNDNALWIEILGGARPASRPRFSSVDESLHYAGYHHFCFDVASVDATLAECSDAVPRAKARDIASLRARAANSTTIQKR